MATRFDVIDRAAMALSAALVLLGIVGMGLLELLAGKPYSPVPLENEAGEILATPMIDPSIRTGLVLLGLLVLFVWGLYRVAQPTYEPERTETGITAD